MSVRTTVAAVRKIIEIDASIIVADTDLDPFIEAANAIVTNACVTTTLYTSPTDDTILEKIERWLAAHCYAIRDPRVHQEAAGSVRAAYESRVDLYLANTRYGQMAMMIDTRGGLAALNRMPQFASRLRPGVLYAGTNPPTGSDSSSQSFGAG